MDYKYIGMPVTPDIVRYWVPRLFGGQEVTRRVIVEAVNKKHIEYGGEDTEQNKIESIFKHLTQRYTNFADIVEEKKGYWKIPPFTSESPLLPPKKVTVVQNNTTLNYLILGSEEDMEFVYVIYYPDSKLYKVGKTTTNLNSRLNSLKTGSAGPFEVKLVIRTTDCTKLETLIHSILKFRNKHVTKPNMGKEIFDTSVHEVLSIYQFLMIR